MADPGMLSQILGLVSQGMSPQEAKTALEQSRLMEMAKMTPAQQTYYGTAEAGSRAASGLGRLLGGGQEEDAMLRKASDFASMRNQIDPTDPKSLAMASQQMYKLGFTAQGDMYAKAAREAQLKLSEIGLKEAEITAKGEEKKTPEQKIAYDLVSKDPLLVAGSPAFNKNYVETLKGLTSKAITPHVDKVGVAESTREPVYFDKASNEQFTVLNGKRVPFNGGIDQTTAKTNVGVKLPEGESEFVKRLGTKDADRVDAAITTRENATNTINSLNKLAVMPSDQLISGQFATGRVGVTNLLTTLGLASPADASKLATSQQYQKVAGDVILQTLGGKLGAGFSNDDRKFIQGLIPQLETNPEARRQLIKFMQDKNQEIVKESIRLENYARTNRGLSGFEPKIPMSVAPTTSFSGLSDAELDARIAAAQAKK